MTHDNRDLAGLMGSRICHDLISPIGAAANGFELLNMKGTELGQEFELISASIENAIARVQFYRVAFGAASKEAIIGKEQIRSILADKTKNSRLSIEWRPETDTRRDETKLAFLLILCLESVMPWGGHIDVSLVGTQWLLIASAERIKIDDRRWRAFSTPDIDFDMGSSDVQFLLAPRQSELLKRSLLVELDEDKITIKSETG